jgi:hypothetical protein
MAWMRAPWVRFLLWLRTRMLRRKTIERIEEVYTKWEDIHWGRLGRWYMHTLGVIKIESTGTRMCQMKMHIQISWFSS